MLRSGTGLVQFGLKPLHSDDLLIGAASGFFRLDRGGARSLDVETRRLRRVAARQRRPLSRRGNLAQRDRMRLGSGPSWLRGIASARWAMR